MTNPWVTPIEQRFNAKVDRSAGPDACHPWTASINGAGYGQIGTGGRAGHPIGAHRVAWEIANGPIHDGMLVLHRCDNKLCCNAAHLFIGTQKENIADMDAKGRARRPVLRGKDSGMAKLTDRRVLAIRAAYANGATQVQLAERFSVSQSTVSSIVLRRTWQHL